MTNIGTIVVGYCVTIFSVAFYAAWIVRRGVLIGKEIGIGSQTSSTDETD